MDLTRLFNDLFVLSLPWLEKIIRPVLVYLFLIAGLRIAGKRELAQLNPFDFVVLMMLSNTVQNAIIGEDNTVLGGIIGAATLLAINYGVVRFIHGHRSIEKAVEGEPALLIENGVIHSNQMMRQGIELAELESGARKQGFLSLREVCNATLETDGSLTFCAWSQDPVEERQKAILDRLTKIEEKLSRME